MRVGSTSDVGKALTPVAYGYAAMPAVLAMVAYSVTTNRLQEVHGLLPGPVLWSMALVGLVLSWNILRRTTARPMDPKRTFQALLVGFVVAEFPILVAFLSVLLGGPFKDYIGVAAMGSVYFLVVALPTVRSMAGR